MTDTTPRVGAPLIAAAQAQKHITHNEGLLQFDCLISASALSRTQTVPPAAPANGDTYLIAAGASGAWTGQDGKLGYAVDGIWRFYTPFAGLLLYVVAERTMLVNTGSGWMDWSSMLTLQNLASLGVNTTADGINKLAVKSAALLFDNTGGNVQAKLNKNGVGDTASILYQSGYSGRAEVGLCGDNDFHFKVSPDGNSWLDAIKINASSGLATHIDGVIPRTLTVRGGGDVNDSASGSGSYYLHSPNFVLPANFLKAGRAIRLTAALRFISGVAPANAHVQLRANNLVIAQHNPGSTGASQANVQQSFGWLLQALGGPGPATLAECAPCVNNSNGAASITVASQIAMPVSLATDVPITLSVATMWESAGTGVNQIKLSQLIVEALN